MSPYLFFAVNFTRENFETGSLDLTTVAVGNTALFTAFGATILLIVVVRARSKLKRRLLIAES